jgi:6-phosphogluconolactonase (cycloisomerase 2 family)
MTLRITLLDASGRVLLEKDYDSGTVSGSRHMISGKLVERTNKLAHEVMYDLMRRAAADVHLYQKTQAEAAAATAD